jgi:MoaA/NifB/PqqE/SkfB family radical SAM enzyme
MITDTFRLIKARLKLPYEILKCHISNNYKPLVILLYLTDRCNSKCRYCVGNWSGRKIKDYTTDEVKKIIDECRSLGSIHITIHGGELLLRNDTKEIIDYLKENKFYVNVVTNGILLPSKIDEIANVDSLCISLDGREENNDYNRGKGTYKASMTAIKLAKEKGFRLTVQSTLTNRSVKDIEYLCRQAKEIGYFQQFSLLLKPLTPEEKELGLSDEGARDALRQILKLKKEGYPVFTSYRALKNAINWPYGFDKQRLEIAELPPGNKLIKCFFGKLKIAIDADGFAYPCSTLNDSRVSNELNVKDVGVKKAYEHILKNKPCEACYYLTQNDWNLLLGGSLRQYMNMAYIHLSEIFRKG